MVYLLKNGVDLSMAMLNNQMVILIGYYPMVGNINTNKDHSIDDG